jgi:endonuclease/exonuclease/phosphatase family metal-dependent hydrolase
MGSGLKHKEEIPVRSTGLQAVFYHIILASTVLILLQSFKEMISSVYYYNLINLGLSPWVITLMVFLAPLFTGTFVRKLGWRLSFIILAGIMASSRLPMGMGLDQPFHLVFSVSALVSSSMLISIFFALHRRERRTDENLFSSQSMTASFTLALISMLVFRIAGSGVDVSIVPNAIGPILSPFFSGIISLGAGFLVYCIRDSAILDDERGEEEIPGYRITGGAVDSWAPAIGLGGALIVSTSILSDPHVVTAWTEQDYGISATITVVSLGLFCFSLLSSVSWLIALRRTFANPWGALIGNAILIGGAFNLFYLGMNMGISPGPITWIFMVDLWVVLDAMSDPSPFAGEPLEVERRNGTVGVFGYQRKKRFGKSPDHFGRIMTIALGIGILFVVLVSFSLNWSFLPFGDILEGAIPAIMMTGVSLFALSGFYCSKGRIEEPGLEERKRLRLDSGSPTVAAGEGAGHISSGGVTSTRLRNMYISIGAAAMVLVLLSGVATILVDPGRIDESSREVGEEITVVTFNIHHGFSNDGRVDPVPHLKELEDLDPDIVFLQEADSLRITEGNFDPGAFLAMKMNMHYYRGSNPGLGNPGTSIMSRFPLEETSYVELDSDGIQRIAVTCVADLGSVRVGLIGVHFGLDEGEREKQFEDLFEIIGSMKNMTILLGGDLNTEPDEGMIVPLDPASFGDGDYSGERFFLRSAWHSTPLGGSDPKRPTYPAEGLDLEKEHIDYIFYSSDLEVIEAGIEPGADASDHRPVWARFIV